MATNLFDKYYTDKTKSAIYTNLRCNLSDASELSFDIAGSAGQISDNNNVLSSIDLSDVHVGLSQYTSDMRILDPYSYLYIRGMEFGDTYESKAFGRIYGEIVKREDWMYKGILFFVIKYTDKCTGRRVVRSLKVKSDIQNDKTFIDVCNDYFTEMKIPVETSYDDGYVIFTSTELGYEFWIDHVMFWDVANDKDIIAAINKWIVDKGFEFLYGWEDDYLEINNIRHSNPYINKNVYSSVIRKSDYSRLYNLLNCLDTDFQTILEENKVLKIHLFEDITRYIPPKKYRNGALLGIVVMATYPIYDAESIYDYQRSLKIAHITDRVQEFYPIPESLFEGTFTAVRKLIDVVDTYHSAYDTDAFNRWMGRYTHINGGDNWIDSDEVPQVVPEMFSMWESSDVPYGRQALSIYKDIEDREVMGIEGYCAYLSKTNNWMNMGQLYARTAVPDDEDGKCKNLIPSLIVYNPNEFPVTIKYLTFSK